MKKIIYITYLILFSFSGSVNGQVGIGTSSPDASAMLDINSTNKGMLFPEYSLTSLTDAVNPVLNPTDGLIIYNTGGTYAKGLYYWLVDSWGKLFVEADVPKSMVLSTAAYSGYNPSSGDTQALLITPTSTNPNKVTTYGQVINNIQGASFSESTGDITLPPGKYKIEFSVDFIFIYPPGWSSSTSYTTYASGAAQVHYVSVISSLRTTSGAVLSQTSLDNEIFTGYFATYYYCHYLELTSTTTIYHSLDWAGNSERAPFKPRTSAELNIIELQDL